MTFLVSTLFSGGPPGGASSASAAAGSSPAFGPASAVLTAIEGIGTVFSALATIKAGKLRAKEIVAQADEQEFLARDERIKGREDSARLKLELSRVVQQQQVTFAAGGVDLGSVSVEQAERRATTDAERELGISQNDALRASLARRRQADILRTRAKNTKRAAKNKAIGKIATFAVKTVIPKAAEAQ